MSVLKKLDQIEVKIDKILEKLESLSTVNLKGDEFHKKPEPKKEVKIHSPGFEDYKPESKDFLIHTKGGKYSWYRFSNQEGRVRKCENEGCDLWLKYNEDKKTYEHWKYDVNTGKGGFVADRCEGVYNG